jgi:hypothetical protein
VELEPFVASISSAADPPGHVDGVLLAGIGVDTLRAVAVSLRAAALGQLVRRAALVLSSQ